MKKLYYVFCGETGEEDAFFDDQDNLIARWSGNDAAYRHEYMRKLFEWAGVEVIPINTSVRRKRLVEHLHALFRNEHGYGPNGEEE